MKKDYIKPKADIVYINTDKILAGSGIPTPDDSTTTEEQNAKENTWGNLWDEE